MNGVNVPVAIVFGATKPVAEARPDNQAMKARMACATVLMPPMALLIAVLAGGSIGVAQLSRTRTIPHRMGEPIADRLRADDEVVVVQREFDAVSSPQDNLTDLIEGAANESELVAVVEVADVTGLLSEGGSWIQTRLEGSVRRVLTSAPTKNVKPGERIEMYVASTPALLTIRQKGRVSRT